MYRHIFSAAIFSVACLSAAHADPINLIANGSFEQGFSGYTLGGSSNGVSPGSGPQIIKYGANATAYGDNISADPFTYSPDASGTHAAYFVDDQASETVLQSTAAMTAGTTYEVGFDFFETLSGARNPGGFSLTESLGGTTLTSFTQANVAYTPGQWYHIFDTVTAATTGSETFMFAYTSGGFPAKDVVVDDLYVVANGTSPGTPNTPTPVPEPASFTIIGLGLVGLASLQRKARLV